MPDVHLDAVEAGLDGQRRRAPVVLGDAFDPGHVDRTQARAPIGVKPPEGESAGARLERALATGPAWPICAAAAAPSGVDGVGEAAQAGDGLFVQQQAVPVCPPFGSHGEIGHGRHGRATGGDAAVEVDQGVADGAAGCDALEGGRLDDAVAQGERAEGRRGEDRRRDRAGTAVAQAYPCRPAGRPHAGVTARPCPWSPAPGPGAVAGCRARSATSGCTPPPGGRGAPGCGW